MQAERDDCVNSHSGPGVGDTHETDSVVNEPTSRYTFYTDPNMDLYSGQEFVTNKCQKLKILSKLPNFLLKPLKILSMLKGSVHRDRFGRKWY